MLSQAPARMPKGLRRVIHRPLRTNTYLLAAPEDDGPGSACVIIDAGLETAAIEAALTETGWIPHAILCTHGHFDHIAGAAPLQQAHQIPVLMHAGDLKTAKLSNFLMAALKIQGRIRLPEFTLLTAAHLEPDRPARSDAHFFAGRSFRFHALPGHTPGGLGIEVDGLFFSGDSLYSKGTALSKLPGEDHAQLRASLQHLFTWLPPETQVCPGHGDTATLAEIFLHNEELKAFMASPSPDALPAIP